MVILIIISIILREIEQIHIPYIARVRMRILVQKEELSMRQRERERERYCYDHWYC